MRPSLLWTMVWICMQILNAIPFSPVQISLVNLRSFDFIYYLYLWTACAVDIPCFPFFIFIHSSGIYDLHKHFDFSQGRPFISSCIWSGYHIFGKFNKTVSPSKCFCYSGLWMKLIFLALFLLLNMTGAYNTRFIQNMQRISILNFFNVKSVSLSCLFLIWAL